MKINERVFEVDVDKLEKTLQEFDRRVARLERVESAARDVVNASRGHDGRELIILVQDKIDKLAKALDAK